MTLFGVHVFANVYQGRIMGEGEGTSASTYLSTARDHRHQLSPLYALLDDLTPSSSKQDECSR